METTTKTQGTSGWDRYFHMTERGSNLGTEVRGGIVTFVTMAYIVVLNPLILDGQIHGGVAQGAAQALLEEVAYDQDGNPITSNLADYGFISAAELPSFEVVHMETPTPRNPLGAKGIGESGTIGSTPAVQSAVVDAVSHLGVRHIDMPATSERVWQAINAARK
jgi:carbon-monoxide dehydrogenase large subunit